MNLFNKIKYCWLKLLEIYVRYTGPHVCGNAKIIKHPGFNFAIMGGAELPQINISWCISKLVEYYSETLDFKKYKVKLLLTYTITSPNIGRREQIFYFYASSDLVHMHLLEHFGHLKKTENNDKNLVFKKVLVHLSKELKSGKHNI